MTLTRRRLLGAAALGGLAALAPTGRAAGLPLAGFKKRLTGADLDTARRWQVAGTDLGIPYVLENGSIGYLFGDTFSGPRPGDPGWRSPVMLRSNVHPGAPSGVVFDSAAKVGGDGFAPEIMLNAYDTSGNGEFTVIPNDGISFPETGRQLVSYMSVRQWYGGQTPAWRTNYAGLAFSDNGNDFVRTPLRWSNNGANTDPFQMWTMQRDGDFVYVFSIRAGRQNTPMMLRRVPWERMFWPEEYEGWGHDGTAWGWGRPPTPIFSGWLGEPSVRLLRDGTWAMAYLNLAIGAIVSRTAPRPEGPWSGETVQVHHLQEPNLYGGFIHPWSTRAVNDLHLMVSTWTDTAYHMSQWVGTL
jgi:hypothetical protein